ncbi:hypothetical protein [Xanthomonas graminis]|uniref:Uncharacterized protein n=1 Tax=Xanthomonas graminis pv. poae TaxID=227946 RepID=A0A199NWV1_9XANT|nr:hypothetical protein [Xanthomonas translucens]OAX53474.1 hypothetical protein A6R73_07105 [Xanthomonas translucens pv. poae]
MIVPEAIFAKCRIFRLRQFQGQYYLIGRMSALKISPLAARAWRLFDGARCLGEIAVRLELESSRSDGTIFAELQAMAALLLDRQALKIVDALAASGDGDSGGAITIEEARIPKALLWGGYNN